MHSPIPRLHPTHGFTLIEVLVALLMLAIGLLGLSALQANSLRTNHQAYLRSQATLFAYQIIDQMRANSTVAYSVAKTDSPSSPSADCQTVTCTPANLANYDIYKWLAQLGNSLPLGDGTIACAAGVCTVTVFWDESRAGSANDSFAMSTEL